MPLLSARQLNEWLAYDRIEPFGEQRADLRAGIVAAATANFSGLMKKDKWLSAEDFMPFRELQAKQDPKALARSLRAAFETLPRKPKTTSKEPR